MGVSQVRSAMRIGGDIDDEEIEATLAYKDHPNKADYHKQS